MKKLLILVCLVFAISTLLFAASASDFSDDSQFLIIYQPYDNNQPGKWYSIVNDSADEYNTMTVDDNEEPLLVYVNEGKAEYNSMDISSFSTEDLVTFILNNRQSMASMLYFSISTDPYEEAKAYYHGLTELENRNDAAEVMTRALNVLKNATPENDTERIIFNMRIRFLEMVLNSAHYQNKMDTTNTQLIELNTYSTEEKVASVNSNALRSAFGFYYDYSGVLSTKSGNNLLLYSARSDYTAAEKQAIRNDLCVTYSSAILMGEATSAYNGYSYALYNQTVGNDRWIFEIDDYIADPHVVVSAYGNWENCETGDVIVYHDSNRNPVHAGIIYNTNDEGVYVISKWDDKCLFKHDVLDVPDRFYYDASTSGVFAYAYTLSSHRYTVTSYNSSKHTYTCGVCNNQYSESHTLNGLGACRFCGFSSSGGLVPVVPGN